MARRQMRSAGKRRQAVLEDRTPKGIMAGVLLEWSQTVTFHPGKPGPVWNASVGDGEYSRPGIGCDLDYVNKKAGIVRCGEKACRWFRYRLKAGGVTFGVRTCAEHVNMAMDEEGWDRTLATADDFAVHEVMTS